MSGALRSFGQSDNTSLESTTEIATATRDCLTKLEQCLSLSELRRDDWSENRLAELRFWSAGVGALTHPKASLDARLANAAESNVRTIVVQLLRLLSTLLEQCLLEAKRDSSGAEQATEDDNDEDLLSKIEDAMQDVDTVMEQLSDLAIAIRKSGTRSRLARADQSFDPQHHQQLRNHLALLIYTQRPKKLEELKLRLTSTESDAARALLGVDQHLDPIQSRLIDNNLRRRHRFLYAQGHAIKLGQESDARAMEARQSSAETTEVIPERRSGVGTISASVSQEHNKQHSQPPGIPRADPTVSSASAVGTKILTKLPQRGQVPGRAQTMISTTGSKIVYPRPPKLSEGALTFTCPACCLPQPPEIALQQHKWRNHIAEDISPYTCVLVSCPKPNVTYITREAWSQHMRKDHQGLPAWECILCPTYQRFFDKSAFQDHLAVDHKGSVKDMESFSAACLAYTPEAATSCPLCNWMEDQNEVIDSTALTDHIAEHIHSFALRSLPLPGDSDPAKLVIPDEAISAVLQWLDDVRKARPETEENSVLLTSSEGISPGLPNEVQYGRAADVSDVLLAADGKQSRPGTADFVHLFTALTTLPISESSADIDYLEQKILVTFEDDSDESAAVSISSRNSSKDQSLMTLGSDQSSEAEEIVLSSSADETDRSPQEFILHDIAAWLGVPTTSDKYEAALSKRCPGTNTWLPLSEQYKSWRRDPLSMLWLFGSPGSGKTILCSSVVENIMEYVRSVPAAIAYHFFTRLDPSTCHLRAFISSIAFQLALASDSGIELLRNVYVEHKELGPGLSEDEAISLLHSILGLATEVYIIIDGVDECLESRIGETLQSIHDNHREYLHILVTSRPIARFVEQAQTASRIKIQDNTRADIDLFIDGMLHEDLSFRNIAPMVQAQIQEVVTEKAAGSFLTAFYQLELLKRYKTTGSLRIALSQMPRSLESIYEDILKQIEINGDLENVIRIFQWLYWSKRPLRLNELVDALAIHGKGTEKIFRPEARLPHSYDITTMCLNLVTEFRPRHSDRAVVLLSHMTVEEYLHMKDSIFYPFFSAHEYFAHATECLSYLLYVCGRQIKDETGLDQYPLARYAASYWWQHLRTADKAHVQDLRPLVGRLEQLFDDSQANVLTWMRLANVDAYKYFEKEPVEWSLTVEDLAPNMYYAAFIGSNDAVENLVKRGYNVNAPGGQFGYALHVACMNRHPIVVKTLLDNDADVNAIGGSHGTAIQAAAYQGLHSTVKLLLDRGAEPNMLSGQYGTALQAASFRHEVETVRLLLEHGADVNLNGGEHGTALLAALKVGVPEREEVVEMLISAGADVNCQDIKHMTPLLFASSRELDRFVDLLITAGADVNAQYPGTLPPLSLSAGCGHQKVVERLTLTPGVELDIRDYDDETPLCKAVKGGFTNVAKILVDAGADVSVESTAGVTLLDQAASEGHSEVVKMLLDAGALVDTTDSFGRTSLHEAASGGHSEVVKMLLDAGALVDTTDEVRWTPLHGAAVRGHSEVVKMLLDAGALVDAKDKNGWTPLREAADHGHIEVVKMLLDAGALVDTTDSFGRTPLYEAAVCGYSEVMKMLLDASAPIDAKDTAGWTPLSRAAYGGYSEVVKMLLDAGAPVDTVDNDGWTPLHRAAYGGYSKVVKMLLDAGAPVDTVDNDGWTPLNRAAYDGYDEVVKMLLDAGAPVDTTDSFSRTPLHEAAYGGHSEIIKMLLDAGAPVDTTDNDRRTPLYRAAHGGHSEVVKMLLDAGADLEIQDLHGQTVLNKALKMKNDATAIMLLDAGAVFDEDRESAVRVLIEASSRGHERTVRTLIDAGVDVNGSEQLGGKTALHAACLGRHSDIVTLLISAGADVNVRGGTSTVTPLELAAELKDHVIIQTLRDAGAQDNVL